MQSYDGGWKRVSLGGMSVNVLCILLLLKALIFLLSRLGMRKKGLTEVEVYYMNRLNILWKKMYLIWRKR